MENNAYQKSTSDENITPHIKTFIANYLEHNKNRLQFLYIKDIKNAMIKENRNTFTEFFQNDHTSELSSLVEEELLKFALDKVDFVVNEAITKAISEVQNSGHPIYKLVQNKGLHQPSKRSYNSLTMPRIQKKSRSNSKRSTASFTTKTTSVIATPALASPTPIICEAPNTSMDIPQTPCLLQKPQTTRVTRQLSSSLNQEMCPNILTKNVQTDATCPKPRRVSETCLRPKKARQAKRRHTIDI